MKRVKTIVVGLSIVGVFAIQLSMQRHRLRSAVAATEICGRYTRQQAIDMSVPVARAILPDEPDLFADARPQNVSRMNGQTQSLWVVECGNVSDAPQVHVVCDAVAGRIQQVSYGRGHRGHDATLPRLPVSAIAAIGQAWLHLIAPNDSWRQVRSPLRKSYTWQLTLDSRDRRASLIIDGIDGKLLYADLKPVSM